MKRLKSRGWLVVALVATLVLVGILANPRLNFEDMPLDQVINAIENGEVKEVVVRNDTDVFAYFADGTQVRTTKPADMYLPDEIDIADDGLGRALQYREESNPIGEIVRAAALMVLPPVIITALYIFYLSRVNAKKTDEAEQAH